MEKRNPPLEEMIRMVVPEGPAMDAVQVRRDNADKIADGQSRTSRIAGSSFYSAN